MLTLVQTSQGFAIDYNMVKAHLRLDADYEKTLIELYIQSSTSIVEAYLQTTLTEKIWCWTIQNPAHHSGIINLPMGPVKEILSIHKVMASGHKEPLHRYEFNPQNSSVACQSPYPLEIVYKSGICISRLSIHSLIQQVILNLVAYAYENRSEPLVLTHSMQQILQPLKKIII